MPNSTGATPPTVPSDVQVIIPLYSFTCTGVITQWKALVEGQGKQLVEFQVYEHLSTGVYSLVGVNRFMAEPLNGFLVLPVPEQDEITVCSNHMIGLFVNGSGWKIAYSSSQAIMSLYISTNNPLNPINTSTGDWNMLQGAPIIDVTLSEEPPLVYISKIQ